MVSLALGLLMEFLLIIVRSDPLDNVRILVGFLKAKKW